MVALNWKKTMMGYASHGVGAAAKGACSGCGPTDSNKYWYTGGAANGEAGQRGFRDFTM